MVDDLRRLPRDRRSSGRRSAAARSRCPYLEQEAFGSVDAALPLLRLRQRQRVHRRVPQARDQGVRHRVRGAGLGVPGRAERRRGARSWRSTSCAASGTRDWIGLREFSQNRYPKLWKPFEHYFPGRPGQQRRRAGHRPHRGVLLARHPPAAAATPSGSSAPTASTTATTWTATTRSGGSTSRRSSASRSTPGVDGVQLDEAELPMGALPVRRLLLQGLHEGVPRLPAGPATASASRSSTASTSRPSTTATGCSSAGYDFKEDREPTPLFGDYYRFQCAAIKRYFAELADYAREYGRSRGRDVLVSGNFFNLSRHYSRSSRRRRPAHHRDAQHDATASRPGTATSPGSPATRTSSSSRTPTAASCPS